MSVSQSKNVVYCGLFSNSPEYLVDKARHCAAPQNIDSLQLINQATKCEETVTKDPNVRLFNHISNRKKKLKFDNFLFKIEPRSSELTPSDCQMAVRSSFVHSTT